MVLPFLFVKWTGYWYIQGCCLKRSPSAWRTDLWIPALRKIPIGISFLVPHHGMNTADSFIRCLFITYCFYPYDIFLWRFETLCGLVRFLKKKNSQCKLFGSLENPNMYGFRLVRFLLVCCFFLWVIKLLESIKLFVLRKSSTYHINEISGSMPSWSLVEVWSLPICICLTMFVTVIFLGCKCLHS